MENLVESERNFLSGHKRDKRYWTAALTIHYDLQKKNLGYTYTLNVWWCLSVTGWRQKKITYDRGRAGISQNMVQYTTKHYQHQYIPILLQVRVTLEKIREKMFGEYDDMKEKMKRLTQEMKVSICFFNVYWERKGVNIPCQLL